MLGTDVAAQDHTLPLTTPRETLYAAALETDAPLVAPAPFRGKRNEPSYVKYVADKLAEILGEDREKIYEQTFSNTRNLFGF